MIRAALFDLDGVIFDTEGQYTQFYGIIGCEYMPDVPDFAHLIKGMTLTQIYQKWFPDQPEIQAEITKRLYEFERQMDYIYFPGVREFILSLRNAGIKTAIVTSSDDAKMHNVYTARPEFQAMFDRILTSKDYAASKPNPDCYLKGAECFHAKPQECLVFEDSVNGLKAGKASGSFVVGLTTTNPAEIVAKYANLVIDSFEQISVSDFLA